MAAPPRVEPHLGQVFDPRPVSVDDSELSAYRAGLDVAPEANPPQMYAGAWDTGNFALLLGVHPDELDQWYLGIYMDAIEWVEVTNTRGMSQFADGGIVGTKPYVSSANYINKLRQKRVIALAMEYIKDESDTFPVVRIMSEMAGISAMLTAAELMSTTSGGKGVLLGGISGVPSAKVVILGAGIVAEYATRTALGLGAEVRIFDNNITKLKRLQNQVGRPLYTCAVNPHDLEKELLSADVAIGAVHSKSGRTPVIVSEDLVAKMKPGAVIIDVSIDQGGCFATSEVTSLEKPTFVKHDVIHYCVPNIASRVSRTASMAVSNILTPILLKAGSTGSIEYLLFNNHGLRHGVYTYKGCLTNSYLGERFEIKSTDLDLLITSNL